MESDSTLPWLIQAASLALFFLASLGEASVASIGRERVLALAAQRVRGSTALEALYATPMGPAGSISLLKAALFASSLVSAVAAVVTQWGVDWALVSMASLATLALLGSGSAISRVLARRFGETVALGAAPVARQLARAAWPLLALEETAARWVLRSPAEEDDNEAMKPEAGLAKESNGQPLDEREARMIRGVVRLDKTTAREIMVPRVDMLAAEMGVPLSHLVQQMVDTGHSRVPVYQDSLDRVMGIAYSRDLLGILSREAPPPKHSLRTLSGLHCSYLSPRNSNSY